MKEPGHTEIVHQTKPSKKPKVSPFLFIALIIGSFLAAVIARWFLFLPFSREFLLLVSILSSFIFLPGFLISFHQWKKAKGEKSNWFLSIGAGVLVLWLSFSLIFNYFGWIPPVHQLAWIFPFWLKIQLGIFAVGLILRFWRLFKEDQKTPQTTNKNET